MKFERPLPSGANSSATLSSLPDFGWGIVLTPVGEESAALQIWDTASASSANRLLQEILLEMEKQAPDWLLVAHPLSNQVAVARGWTMKVWDFAKPQPDCVYKPNSFIPQVREAFGFLPTPDTVFAPAYMSPLTGAQSREMELEVVNIKGDLPKKESAVALLGGQAAVASVSREGSVVAAGVWSPSLGDQPTRLQLYRPGYLGLEPVRELNISAALLGFQLNADGSRLWLGNEVVRTDVFAPSVLVKRSRFAPFYRKISRTPFRGVQRWLNNTRLVEIVMAPADVLKIQGKAQGRAFVVWNTDTGEAESVLSAPEALAITVSPDDAFLAEAGADKKVRIRSAKDLSVEKEFRVHDSAVSAVEWHPTRPWLATASEDRLVRIWDVNTGAMLEEFGLLEESPSTLYWSPDGVVLALCMENSRSYFFLRPKVARAQDGPAR